MKPSSLSLQSDPNDKGAFEKYLTKSLCTELVNGIFHQIANDQDLHIDQSKELNADQRLKLLGQIPKDISEHLIVIHKALSSNKPDECLHSLEEHLGEACDVMIRKADKTKDRQTHFNQFASSVYWPKTEHKLLLNPPFLLFECETELKTELKLTSSFNAVNRTF